MDPFLRDLADMLVLDQPSFRVLRRTAEDSVPKTKDVPRRV